MDNKIDYQEYITSPEWRVRARECKKAARNRCQLCNSDRALNAHHRTYERLGNEEKEDLTCLCSRCHKLFHDNIDHYGANKKKPVKKAVKGPAEIPRYARGEGEMKLTRSKITALMSNERRFTEKTLRLLGCWPRRSGWTKKVKGTMIPKTRFRAAFMARLSI